MRRNVRTVIILAAFVVVNVWATDYYVAQNGQTPEFPYASPEFVNNSGGGQTLAKGSKLLPAEEDGWQLAFEDNFDREELGENWTVVDGKWKIQDGDLRGFGTLILAQEFPCGDTIGFQRLEFEAVTDVHPMIFFENKPKPTVVVGDMSSFIHAQPPEKGDPVLTGYFFQFGGLNNTKTQLLRGGEVVDLEGNLDKMITPDVVQRVVIENDMGTLRMFIDGVLIFEHKEQQSIMGQGHERIGFYFHTAAKVFDVKVYVKKLPSGLDIE